MAQKVPNFQGMLQAKKGGDSQIVLERLRDDIARLEGRLAEEARLSLTPAEDPETEGQDPAPSRIQPLGVPRLDAMLGGGLATGSLHEIRSAETRDAASAAGFLIALMTRLDLEGAGPVIWISEADSRREAGELYPPGLAALGLDPGRIVRIAAPRTIDALWAFETALTCRGAAFAICEVRRPARMLDLTATRRCMLRAQVSGTTGFLLRLAQPPEPTAATVRFAVAPAPSPGPSLALSKAAGIGIRPGPPLSGIGRPVWQVRLEKTRSGRTGRLDLEWNADERCFAEPGARKQCLREQSRDEQIPDSVAVAAAAFHRSAGPGRQSAA